MVGQQHSPDTSERASALLDAFAAEARTGPFTVYRAAHEAIVMGLYTTAEAARAHCEDAFDANVPGLTFAWIEDEEDGTAELAAAFAVGERPTGYVVTTLTAEAAYDPEADA
nr:hypothetical protein [Streptomyces sp. SID11385]